MQVGGRRTLVYADHQPLEERLVRERSALQKKRFANREDPYRHADKNSARTFVSSLYNSGYINAKSSFTSVSNTNENTGAIV